MGRTAIFKILPIIDSLKNLIISKESGVKLKNQALAVGMKTMFADGLARAILGVTDLKELLRVAAQYSLSPTPIDVSDNPMDYRKVTPNM